MVRPAFPPPTVLRWQPSNSRWASQPMLGDGLATALRLADGLVSRWWQRKDSALLRCELHTADSRQRPTCLRIARPTLGEFPSAWQSALQTLHHLVAAGSTAPDGPQQSSHLSDPRSGLAWKPLLRAALCAGQAPREGHQAPRRCKAAPGRLELRLAKAADPARSWRNATAHCRLASAPLSSMRESWSLGLPAVAPGDLPRLTGRRGLGTQSENIARIGLGPSGQLRWRVSALGFLARGPRPCLPGPLR